MTEAWAQGPMLQAMLRASCTRIAAATRVLLVTHKRPDGDALGSMLGLGWALEAAGRHVTHVDGDGCPANFRFLPGHEKIQSSIGPCARPCARLACDLVIALDISDPGRLGPIARSLPRPVDINVDHHITNTSFGAINIVDPESTSTAEIVLRLLEPWGLSLTEEVAHCLLTGLVTDTIGFRTANTTPATLEAATRLMRHGAPLTDIIGKALYARSYTAARLWGAGLSRLEMNGQLVYTALSLADKQALGYHGRDDADLVNMLTTVEGADVVVMFVEQTPSLTKVSWRASPDVDITPVAKSFGGGGHPAASGAEIAGTLDQVRARVLAATREYLNVKRET